MTWKKFFTISAIVIAALILAAFSIVLYLWISTSGFRLDEKKLKLNFQMTAFYDDAGEILERNATEAVKLEELKKETVQAFIAVEDRSFYTHSGVNFKRIMGATLKNIASLSFKEGGSTISQQLIKNTHLTNEKTIRRKFAELRLTRELEQKYSKDEIMELYLNSIYFGKSGYGISGAARGMYAKPVQELTLAESASLAGVIKSPNLYSPYLHYDSFLARRNLVLRLMHEQEMISAEAYSAAVKEVPDIHEKGQNSNLAYLNGALDECASLLRMTESQINSLGLKIYTNLSQSQQKLIERASKNRIQSAQYYANMDNSIVILDNVHSRITALYSSNPYSAERKRQPASVIKPLLVYAPAIENGLIEPATLIEDKKERIGDFSPSNYRDKYYGSVSARFALANSLNIPAVKLLNSLGVDRAMRYLEANGMTVDRDSYHLASALGGFTEGMTLKELCDGYKTLANGGLYRKSSFVRRIEDAEGRVLYEEGNSEGRRVFSEQTAFLTTDMLAETVKSGTAKPLRSLEVPLCAKTGTNGSDKGNRDAYTLSYNRGFTVGVWLGSETLFDNSVTGSTLPCSAAREVWSGLIASGGRADLKTEWGFRPPEGVYRQTVDAETLKKDLKFELADENAPEGSSITDYFKTQITAQSTKYSNPTVRDFKTERRDDTLKIGFFGEKRFHYLVYDNDALLFECDGEDSPVEFRTDPLKNRHKVSVTAVYAEKEIEGEPLTSEEFVFSCDFVPDEEKPEKPGEKIPPDDDIDPGFDGTPPPDPGHGDECWWW